MGQLVRRALMVLVGCVILVVYALGALAGYLALGWVLAEPPGLGVVVLTLAVVTLLGGYVNYRVGTARLLAGVDASVLPRAQAPGLYRRFDGLTAGLDGDAPTLLVADLGVPNALSVGGPRESAIILDRRLLRLLTLDELEGILAHELAHIERRDAFLQTMAVSGLRMLAALLFVVFLPVVLLAMGFARAWSWMSGRPADRRNRLPTHVLLGVQLLVGLFLSVLTLVVFAYSRRREYAADERAAELTGNPQAVARGLVKIHRATSPRWSLRSLLTIRGDEGDGLGRLVSTHPPVEERVERLVGAASLGSGRRGSRRRLR